MNRDRAIVIIGRLLSIWSAVTLTILVVSMLVLPWFAPRVSNISKSTLINLSARSEELASAVEDAEETLNDTAQTLESSALALEAAHTNIEEIKPLLDSIHKLLSVEAPDTIRATQDALGSAQSGAKAMDQVLRVLSSLRFLTGVRYDPDQPLDVAMQGVSESLDPMPKAFTGVSDELEDFRHTLDEMDPEILDTIDQMGQMSKSLQTFSRSVAGQVDDIEDLASSLKSLAQSSARRVWTAVIVLELILFQLIMTQVALLYVGRQLVEKSNG